MDNNFFEKQTRSSKIKAHIVSEYFPKYCKIISKSNQDQIRFLDLFAGPGVYDDGKLSTPILVGKACANDPDLKNKVWLMFNDNEHIDKLRLNFEVHFPDKNTFKYTPIFGDKTVGKDEKIRSYLLTRHQPEGGKNPYPTLLFIDPFGYKAIDTRVLAEFMKDWGNEIFLFLNAKRIHAAVENEKFDELMGELFPTTINVIRNDRKYKLNVEDRLKLIIENLAKEYKLILGEELYHTPFKFQEEDSLATSHYILHFTKHHRGYDLVKQIYNDFDNIGAVLENGTYTFDAKKLDEDNGAVLDFGDQNIYALSKQLLEQYKGKKISAMQLFEEHQKKSNYARDHYVQTLRQMVEDNEITSVFTDDIEHKRTVLLSDKCILQF